MMAPRRPDTTSLLRSIAGPGIAALLTVLVQLPYFRLWFAFMDEGHMVQFASIAQQGGEFYRDATFYPLPGAFWLLAGVFDVFGTSLLVSRWLVMLEFALFVALIFVLLRRLTDVRFAMLGVAAMWLYRIWSFPHWQIYSYSTTSLLVLLAAVCTLLAAFRSRDRRVLAAAGFIYGLGVLCKQDYGAAALVAVLVGFAAQAASVPRAERSGLPTSLLLFFGPAALVGAATGLYYWNAGILEDLIRFTVTNHFVGMGQYEYLEFPSLWPVFGQDAALRTKISLAAYMPAIAFTADWQAIRGHALFNETALYDTVVKLIIFTPPVYVALSLLRVFVRRAELHALDARRRERQLGETVLATFAAALITLVWLNKPQDYLHLAVLYWPLICLAIVQLHALLAHDRRTFFVLAAVALLPTIVFVAYSLRLVGEMKEMHSELVGGRRGGVYVQPSEAAMLRDVVDYVRQNSGPDDRVAAIPYFPIINFLAERMGPHRSAYIIWPFPEVPERDQQVVAAMESTGTDLVIYNFTQFHGFDRVWQHAPILFAYLVDEFEIDRVFSYDAWGYKLAGLKRSSESDRPGERIIAPGAVGERLFVDDGGPPRPVPPESRAAYVQEIDWPFRPTIALLPSIGERRTVLSVPLEVPEGGGRLQSAIAVHPQWWFKLPPSWIEFVVTIETEAGREVVFERRINPTMVLADRGWSEVDVPLDRWAGQRIEVGFSNRAQRVTGAEVWMGGWAVPRLVPPENGIAEPAVTRH